MPYSSLKKYIIAILVLWSFQASAQLEADRTDRYLYDLSAYRDSSFQYSKLMIGMYGSGEANSNAITNSFFSHLLYTGAYISDDMKEDVNKKLKDKNRLCLDEQIKISGAYKINKNTWFTLGLTQRLFTGGTMSKDGFNLVFYGNSMFAGQTAQLHPTNLYQMDYFSLSTGIMKQVNSKLTVAGELSFIRGGNYRQIKMDRGTLYTDPNGAYLELDSKFKVAYSDSSQSAAFPHSSGKGAAISLYTTYQVNAKTYLSFELKDLGFIAWKDLNVYEGDSVYKYDGYSISNILDPNGSLVSDVTIDTIMKQIGINKQKQSFSRMLPTTMHISIVHHLNKKWSIAGGAKYMFAPGYIPRVYVKPIYYLSDQMLVSSTLAYGGYGKADVILSCGWKYSNKLMVSIDALFLEYMIAPNSTSGNGIQFSITGLF
jgi:hypothetical protein